jgi:hypothetical protein
MKRGPYVIDRRSEMVAETALTGLGVVLGIVKVLRLGRTLGWWS